MVVAEDRELITVAEAARRFGVTPQTIYRWIERGLIQPYEQKIPPQVFVDAKEIERGRTPRPRDDGR